MSFKNISNDVLLRSLKNITTKLKTGKGDFVSRNLSAEQANRIVQELESRGVIDAGFLFERNIEADKKKDKPDIDDDNLNTAGGDGDDIGIMLAGAGGRQPNRLLGIVNQEIEQHAINKYRDDRKFLVPVNREHDPVNYENMKYVRRSRQADRVNILSAL